MFWRRVEIVIKQLTSGLTRVWYHWQRSLRVLVCVEYKRKIDYSDFESSGLHYGPLSIIILTTLSSLFLMIIFVK